MNLPVIYGVLAIFNIPIFILLGKLFFGSWENFGECVRYWLTPDAWSWFQGRGIEDWISEMKLGLFLLICGGLVYGETMAVKAFFQSIDNM